MNKKSFLDMGLLVLRVGVGAIMLTHGIPKLQTLLSSNTESFPDPLGVGALFSLVLATFAEVFASSFIIVGLFTRISAAVLIFEMGVAAFVFHEHDAFAVKELAIVYMVIYLTLMLVGPGKYSLSNVLAGKFEKWGKIKDL